MLNIGIIGDVQALENYVVQIRNKKDAQVIGKSSVGINSAPNSFQFTIPEFNKIELVERSDALIINNFSLLSFSTLCNIVKHSKHIFATDYPELSLEECSQLVKLTNESKTVFQFINPFFHLPAIQWMHKNLNFPALIDVSCFTTEVNTNKLLIRLLLMFRGTKTLDSKKIGAVSFKGGPESWAFSNLNLQLGDATVVNIDYGKMDELSEFVMKGVANSQFALFNFNNNSFSLNGETLPLKLENTLNELDYFIETASGEKNNITTIEDYFAVIEAIQRIDKKMSQFTGQ